MLNVRNIFIVGAGVFSALAIGRLAPADHIGFAQPPQIVTIHEFTPAPPALPYVCPDKLFMGRPLSTAQTPTAPPVKRHVRH